MNEKPPANPYVGPRAIQAGEAFYGREREIRSLTALLVSERIVLLHSPSGAGKTSLIQAGLIPALRERFRVLPIVRVNAEPPVGISGSPGINRYMLSTLISLEEGRPVAERLPLNRLAELDLDSYLEQIPRPDDTRGNLFLVFDQFEEVLTTSLTDQPAKGAFFEGLGEALQNRHRWALFAVREDYMGGLAPYTRHIPNRLSVPFRIDLLSIESARQAIQEPARAQGVDFTDEAAGLLVSDLSRVQAQQPDGSFLSQAGQYVEPVQLQVVCYRLWETRAAGDPDITPADLKSLGNVDQALSDYYAGSVESACAQTGIDQRAVREWFEYHLITEGIRSQVLMGAKASDGLDNRAIRILENAHIIRAEKRAGATWFELAHDRLVEPVYKSNAAWFAANLSLLQRQSTLWIEQDRSEGLLLRDKELDEIENEAGIRSITADEQAFLYACFSLRQRENQRERKRNRFMTFLAVGATVGMVLAIILGVFAFFNANLASTSANNAQFAATAASFAQADAEAQAIAASTARAIAEENQAIAEYQASIARIRELTALATSLRQNRFSLSLLLGIEAYRSMDTPETRSALLDGATSNPKLRYSLLGASKVLNIVYSPDGRWLTSGSEDGAIMLWDLSAEYPLGEILIEQPSKVSALAFTPDGSTLAAASEGGTISLWDVETRRPIGEPLEDRLVYGASVTSLAFSPDGKMLASGNDSGLLFLWDLQTFKPIGELSGHGTSVLSLAFSPDGTMLASGGGESTIILWEVETRQPIGERLAGHTSSVTSLAFSPDGTLLASGSEDSMVILWEVASARPIGEPLAGHTSAISSVAFSPDGGKLASGSADSTIILWDLETRQRSGDPLSGHSNFVSSLAFSADGKTLASGSYDQSIILWDLEASQRIGRRLGEGQDFVGSVAYSPDGKMLASAGADGAILLWDVQTETSRPLQVDNSLLLYSLAFSPDGKTLASEDAYGTIFLWDVQSETSEALLLEGNSPLVFSLAFSPDSKTLASVNPDGAINLWNVQTGAIERILGGPLTYAFSLAFSPDGKRLASGNLDSTITLWDVQSGAVLSTLTGHSDSVYSLAFSPDGRILASGSADSTIVLWDVGTRQPLGEPLAGHTSAVTGLAFSPDGKMLASGGGDSKVILWDVATGQPVGGPLSGHSNFVTSVAFNPDGSQLASSSADGAILLWEVGPEAWVERSCQRVGRNLTLAEWEEYFPGEPYRVTCPQWPVVEQ